LKTNAARIPAARTHDAVAAEVQGLEVTVGEEAIEERDGAAVAEAVVRQAEPAELDVRLRQHRHQARHLQQS